MQLAVTLAMISWPLALLLIAAAVYLQKTGTLKAEDLKSTDDGGALAATVGKVQLRTQSLLIAILIVAVLGACLLPGLALYLDYLAEGNDPALSLTIDTTAANQSIELGAPGFSFGPGAPVSVTAFRSKTPVNYVISGSALCPTSISVWYSVDDHAIEIADNTHGGKSWKIKDLTHPVLAGPPLSLDTSGCTQPTAGVANVPSPSEKLEGAAPAPPVLQ